MITEARFQRGGQNPPKWLPNASARVGAAVTAHIRHQVGGAVCRGGLDWRTTTTSGLTLQQARKHPAIIPLRLPRYASPQISCSGAGSPNIRDRWLGRCAGLMSAYRPFPRVHPNALAARPPATCSSTGPPEGAHGARAAGRAQAAAGPLPRRGRHAQATMTGIAARAGTSQAALDRNPVATAGRGWNHSGGGRAEDRC